MSFIQDLNPAHMAFICMMIVLITLSISYCSNIIRMDTQKNEKKLRRVVLLAFPIGIVAYILAIFHFSSDSTYVYQFLLAIAGLIILPAALLSVAVATITASNK
jgi:Na+/proline symporter